MGKIYEGRGRRGLKNINKRGVQLVLRTRFRERSFVFAVVGRRNVVFLTRCRARPP